MSNHHFDALTRVGALFARMSDLVDRINAIRAGADARWPLTVVTLTIIGKGEVVVRRSGVQPG